MTPLPNQSPPKNTKTSLCKIANQVAQCSSYIPSCVPGRANKAPVRRRMLVGRAAHKMPPPSLSFCYLPSIIKGHPTLPHDLLAVSHKLLSFPHSFSLNNSKQTPWKLPAQKWRESTQKLLVQNYIFFTPPTPFLWKNCWCRGVSGLLFPFHTQPTLPYIFPSSKHDIILPPLPSPTCSNARTHKHNDVTQKKEGTKYNNFRQLFSGRKKYHFAFPVRSHRIKNHAVLK